MRILDLHAINFKGAVDIHIRPDPDQNVIMITGKNKQGKTSAIDAIWAALLGAEISKVTPNPRRTGEKRASIRLDLGEYIVLREWDKDDIGRLTITSPRGAVYSSPQKLLDGLVAKSTMDPLGFIKLKGPDQVKALIAMLGDALTFDPKEIEDRRKQADAYRAGANKEVKSLAARLAAMPTPPADTPAAVVSTADVLAEYSEAQALNSKIDEAGRGLAGCERMVTQARADVEEAEKSLAYRITTLETAKAYIEALPPAVDLDAISARLSSVEETNDNVRAALAAERVAAELADAEGEARRYDAELEAIKQEKADALAAVVWPSKGLSFDGDTVLYNGYALEQASDSEKRIVGIDMAIAQNPELRVIRVDQGESLDNEARAHIAQLAEERDLQVWMTFVGHLDDDNVIVIHEGQVAA
jgi:DNA repair exonuclease SbcCD ATPase subunit